MAASYILPITGEGLPNFYKINANLYRGGQPTKEGLSRLKKLGIKTVISLRSDFIITQRERRLAEKLKINFINVPLSGFRNPGKKKIENLLRCIADRNNQPVYLHCRSGRDRTGMVVAAYRIIFERWNPLAAHQEAKRFGFREYYIPLKRFIFRNTSELKII